MYKDKPCLVCLRQRTLLTDLTIMRALYILKRLRRLEHGRLKNTSKASECYRYGPYPHVLSLATAAPWRVKYSNLLVNASRTKLASTRLYSTI